LFQASLHFFFRTTPLIESRGTRLNRDLLVLASVCPSVCLLQIFFYSTGIYRNAGVPESAIEFAVVGTCAVNVCMTVVAVS